MMIVLIMTLVLTATVRAFAGDAWALAMHQNDRSRSTQGNRSASDTNAVDSILPRLNEDDFRSIEQWWRSAADEKPPLVIARAVYYTQRLPRDQWSAVESNQGEASETGIILPVPRLIMSRGVVAELRALGVTDETVDLLGIGRLWSIAIDCDDGTHATIIAADIPERWRDARAANDAIGQTVRCRGVVVAQVASSESNENAQIRMHPLMVTSRLEWLPQVGSATVPEDWVALAAEGIDASRWENMRRRMNEPLGAEDTVLFYDLLELQDAPSSSTHGARAKHTPLADVLAKPSSWVGRFVRMEAWTRRITRVAVTDAAMRTRLGQDHYWEVDAFVDLGDINILIDQPGKRDEGIAFGSRYPIQVVALRLPEGLRNAMTREGGEGVVVSRVNLPLDVTGVLMRMWSYESEFTKEHGIGRQFAPLITSIRLEDGSDHGVSDKGLQRFSWVWASIVLLTLGGGTLFVFVNAMNDRRKARTRLPLDAEQANFLRELSPLKTLDSAASEEDRGPS